MTKLIHSDLSCQVRGVLLDIFNSLGPNLQEKHYTNAAVIGLSQKSIPCEAEKPFGVFYEGEQVGLSYVDLWVDGGKIILENKVQDRIEPLHEAQTLSYLKLTGSDLALLVNFGSASLQVKSFPNHFSESNPTFNWQTDSANDNVIYPELSNEIMRICHQVHFMLGPGYFRQVYRRATIVGLRRCHINYENIKQMPVEYLNNPLGHEDARVILVEDKILLATVAVHGAKEPSIINKLPNFMRRLSLQSGILANFYGTKLSITPVRIR